MTITLDSRALAENEMLRAEIKRLREVLRENACSCGSIRECVSEMERDGNCPHLNARKVLEA